MNKDLIKEHWEAVLSTESGREVVADLIEHCGLMHYNGSLSGIQEGRRQVALYINQLTDGKALEEWMKIKSKKPML